MYPPATHPDPDVYVAPLEERRLQELHRWLTWEGISSGLSGLAFVVPYGLVFMGLKWSAIIFTPYMLWRLYQAGRFGWITGFGVAVGLPALLVFSLRPGGVPGFVFSMFPLASFYFYTWLLRYTVGEWLETMRWERGISERSAPHTDLTMP